MTKEEYLERVIGWLTAGGRLSDTQVDRAVQKGLLKAEKAQAIKDKKPKPPQGGGNPNQGGPKK